MRKCLKVVVVGDVDAGKSTLIGRFLYECGSVAEGVLENIEESCLKRGSIFEFAYLLDSFEEERQNQLTLETTQAFCRDKQGRQWVLIDVPGHRELIKNMIVGSSYADIAVLVVDTRESLKEQAKRHIHILKFLGIKELILVINKMDSVGYYKEYFTHEKTKFLEFLGKLNIKPGYCIPAAAKQGDNLVKNSQKMRWYKGKTLIEALAMSCRKEKPGDFRLPVQDIYKNGKQSIIAGMVISGRIRTGQKITILPDGREAKIKQIKVFNKDSGSAGFPENIGLVLDQDGELRRGMVLCKPKLPKVTTKIMAKIFCVIPVGIKESLSFKSSSQDTAARIKKVITVWDSADLGAKPQSATLQALDLAEIALDMDNPVVIEQFHGINSLGRFVLENKNREICAAGIIL